MKTRELILAGLLAAIIAVMAPWSLPLPLVPITLQTLIIPIVASIANTKISLAAIVVYLLLGIVGLPVFAGGASG
ncbi:biotin transporter BioY, partial [Weissella soli]|uniref:biotin transporter BioY n=1 Tax=Weissella soli TaxID=155866 RepID=UPI0035A0A703